MFLPISCWASTLRKDRMSQQKYRLHGKVMTPDILEPVAWGIEIEPEEVGQKDVGLVNHSHEGAHSGRAWSEPSQKISIQRIVLQSGRRLDGIPLGALLSPPSWQLTSRIFTWSSWACLCWFSGLSPLAMSSLSLVIGCKNKMCVLELTLKNLA